MKIITPQTITLFCISLILLLAGASCLEETSQITHKNEDANDKNDLNRIISLLEQDIT